MTRPSPPAPKANDVVGSDESALQNALSKASKNSLWVNAKLNLSGKKLQIALPAMTGVSANLLLVGYQKYASNDVPRGENAGATLSHRNSVTSIIRLGNWEGEAFSASKDKPEGDGVALLIQSSDTGEIIEAVWL